MNVGELVTWVDGELVPAGTATISAHDRAFRAGEGVFETLRCSAGQPFRPEAHVRRAVDGAAALGFELDPTELETAVHATAEANTAALDGEDGALRLTASPGPLDPTSPFPGSSTGRPTVVVSMQPLPRRTQPTPGARAVSVHLQRPLAAIKSTSYVVANAALRTARAHGADTGLLLSEADAVLEAATANVFAVLDGTLVTPPADGSILAGITRQVTLELAAHAGMATSVRPLERRELHSATEALVTSSVAGLVALIELDGDAIGDGRPGPLTARLQAAYRDEVARETRP